MTLRWRSAALFLIAILAVAGMFLMLRRQNGSHAGNGSGTPNDAIAVTSAKVTVRKVRREMAMVGTLAGWEEVAVAPKVDGRVASILHDIGDRVKPDEPLLEIDSTDYRNAKMEAARMLEWELTRLGLSALPTTQLDATKLPSVQRAAANEQNAAGKSDRLRRLPSATREERDQADAELAMAKADLRQALLDAETNLAAARQRQAQVDTAQQRILDTVVVAPKIPAVPGLDLAPEYVVAKRNASPGDLIRGVGPTSSEVFRLVMAHPLKLLAALPERFQSHVKPGLRVEVKVEAFPNEVFEGTVDRVNPVVDRESRTFDVQVRVPNPARRLGPGSFAKATLHNPNEISVLTVPQEAVVSFAGVKKVFVIREGAAREVLVDLGESLTIRDGTQTSIWLEVSGTLRSDELVVTSGQAALVDGTKVRERVSSPSKEPRS